MSMVLSAAGEMQVHLTNAEMDKISAPDKKEVAAYAITKEVYRRAPGHCLCHVEETEDGMTFYMMPDPKAVA